jgi:hypothetical protein
MNAPTERQVLYALVALGFHAVVAVLVAGAAIAGSVPQWWTITMTIAWVAVVAVVAPRWRLTGRVLGSTILLFVIWTIGTLVVS